MSSNPDASDRKHEPRRVVPPSRGVFITSTGTGAGKTFVARGLAAALRARAIRVAALKPFETGCEPDPLDALALERAAGTTGLARHPQFYRAALPASPYAATLAGEPPPELEDILQAIAEIGRAHEFTIVEGAGGLLVPLSAHADMATLASRLGYPILITAPNQLGVLSHVRAIYEVALLRKLSVAALVMTQPNEQSDASSSSNATILAELLSPTPVLSFPHVTDDDPALAHASVEHAIPQQLGWLSQSHLTARPRSR